MRKLGYISAAILLSSIGSSALAADLIIEEPMAPVMDYAAPSGWEGAYIGIHGGYGWGEVDASTGDVGDHEIMGGFLGGQVGYNFVLGNDFVVGVQGDLSWANIGGEYEDGFTIEDTLNWTGSATVHLGFDGGVFMPYVLGGVAFASNNHTDDIFDTDITETHVGYTVGAGVNVMVSDSISAFGEVRYTDYGTAEYDLTPGPGLTDIGITDVTARVGLNFHF